MLLKLLRVKTPGLYKKAHPKIVFSDAQLSELRANVWIDAWAKIVSLACLTYGAYWMAHHGPLGGLLGISFAGLFYGCRGATPAFVFDAIQKTIEEPAD